MALNIEILRNGLYNVMVPTHPTFVGFGETKEAVATSWSEAIGPYISSITPPSTGIEFSKQTFKNILLQLDTTAQNGNIVLKSAFSSMASIIASGMLPIFAGVPPVAPIVFEPVFALGLSGASGQQCADAMAGIIDAWFRTGTATPTASGPTINWN